MANTPINQVVNRINATYGKWTRDTKIRTMRADWDSLFSDSKINAKLEDFDVAGIPCRWVNSGNLTSNAIVIYIHGGGFRLGSIDSHLKLMSDIACATGCRVLGFNYRLMPEHMFPAALEDTLTIYRWLLSQGYAPDNIIIAGDSVGGGLAASLTQKTRQLGDVPMPGGLVLLSPWLDMTLSGDSYESRSESDPVHQKNMLKLLAELYSGGCEELHNPLLSPLFGDLTELPPTLIQYGDCEVGLDDGISYAQQARKVGSQVELEIWPEMIHVFQMFADELEQAREAIQKISVFISATVDK